MKFNHIRLPSVLLIVVFALILIAARPMLGSASPFRSLTPDEASVVLLGIVGVFLQVLFRYVPKASDWYQAQENKGLIMLGLVFLAAVIYFGLACTPLAGQIGIAVSCTVPDLFVMLRALLIIATAQSVTYLYTKPKN